jgi:hypothetical protein
MTRIDANGRTRFARSALVEVANRGEITMRGKRKFIQDLLRIALAMSLALYPAMSIAQDVAKTPSPGNTGAVSPPTGGTGPTGNLNVATPAKVVTTAAESTPTPPGPPKTGTGQGTSSVAVYLRVDSNLAGRVSVLDPGGKRRPAKAHISFIRGGKTVSAVDASDGRFQVRGLPPGVYSVIASGPDGFAVVALQILPYAKDGPNDPSLLDITLVPSDDADALSKLLAPEPADLAAPPATEGVPVYGSGGGSGGGGGGLGIAALAMGAVGMGLGIGAIAKGPASPSH